MFVIPAETLKVHSGRSSKPSAPRRVRESGRQRGDREGWEGRRGGGGRIEVLAKEKRRGREEGRGGGL